jgi:hypothetical protein
MLDIIVLRTALAGFSTLFGSLGVFFLWCSVLKPTISPLALFFLAVASGVVLATPK